MDDCWRKWQNHAVWSYIPLIIKIMKFSILLQKPKISQVCLLSQPSINYYFIVPFFSQNSYMHFCPHSYLINVPLPYWYKEELLHFAYSKVIITVLPCYRKSPCFYQRPMDPFFLWISSLFSFSFSLFSYSLFISCIMFCHFFWVISMSK